jgi:nitrite reductase (NADH) small subunit
MSGGKWLVTTIDQIPAGEGRMFRVGGADIAVFHTHAGEVFATQSHCPHRDGPLADGLIGGATVVCPLHDRTFDLKTGCGLSHERLALSTYPLELGPTGQIWLKSVVAASVDA